MWRQRVIAGRRAGQGLPANRYFELSYEELIHEPDQTMREVCAFIGEQFISEVLVPTRRPVVARQSRTAWNRPEYQNEITTASVGAWRTRMSDTDRDRFERVAGDLLTELGYPVLGDAHPLTPLERALWAADDWSRRGSRIRQRQPVEFRNSLWLRPTLAAARLRRTRSA